MSLNFSFIGAGNLAFHLAKALHFHGFQISQVYNRTESSAKELAEITGAKFTSSLSGIESTTDVYIVAVKDSAIDEVLSQIDFQDKLVVHCSGSLPVSVLEKYTKNFGVIYPLQTFSKKREVNFSDIPVFIEANSPKNLEILRKIAGAISEKVSVADSEQRQLLHISAVFACNFVNHLYSTAGELLKTKNISFDVLKPLILETALKVQELQPFEAQTGPAVRFDKNVIDKHLEKLADAEEYQQLYELISKSIFEHHKKLNE
jgi:predicted short-subunit dehydrogenase-like oxidoreductase (DUF2520 family)